MVLWDSNLIINLMIGTSAGSGVVVAQLFGAGREREVSRAVHTALLFSFMLGIVLSAIGILVARPALILMGTKAELLDRAVLYLSIICLGIPGLSLYNFGSSILRAVGDSKRPFYFLVISLCAQDIFSHCPYKQASLYGCGNACLRASESPPHRR